MQIDYKKENGVLKVILNGEIDHHNCKNIRESLDLLISETAPEKLVLDFSKVEFMDSSGIAIILGRYKRMRENAKGMEISGARGTIRRMLEISAIDKLIKVI